MLVLTIPEMALKQGVLGSSPRWPSKTLMLKLLCFEEFFDLIGKGLYLKSLTMTINIG
jgi:hypothetical protein